jgi:putative phosphoesterase
MHIALISDTHSYLGNDVIEQMRDVDEIWHAGDLGSIAIMDQLKEIAPTRIVWGNIDGNEIRSETEKDLMWDADGVQVFMTHIGGYPGRYYKSPYHLIKKHQPNLFICGHSHILKVMRDKENNLLHMNPGACGVVGLHKFRTMLKFEINKGKIENLRAIELGPRSSN